MRAVVQRVDTASVSVHGEVIGRIDGPGLMILVGVTHGDDEGMAARLAQKAYDLRIFETDRIHHPDVCVPPGSPREISAGDLGLPVLVISQFTLYGDTRKGRRPTWDAAAPGHIAEPLVEAFVTELRRRGAQVATGRFGADMQVSLVNDGPVTILLEIPPEE
jgi:D-tyrosyl-tRNA(Tyr) deacylase